MSANELIERTNQRLGSVQSPMMEGDNLAILLCTYFENPDQDCEDDTGWTPDSIKGQDEVLNAIRAHYQPMADILASQEAEIERVLAANKDCLLHFDVMKAENESLREALLPFVQGYSHTAVFLSSREKMHSCGRDLYAQDVERARQALKGTGADHG